MYYRLEDTTWMMFSFYHTNLYLNICTTEHGTAFCVLADALVAILNWSDSKMN